MITVRRADYEDIPSIMKFIDDYWKKGHILARDRRFFEWQFTRGREVFYILAENEEGEIVGSMGYIPMNYDRDNFQVSPVMIRTLRTKECFSLGHRMSVFLEEALRVKNIVSIGIEKKYASALAVLHPGRMGMLEHYYRLGERQEYRIAKLTGEKRRIPAAGTGKLEPAASLEAALSELPESGLKKRNPYESREYLIHRFQEHPYYSYRFLKTGTSKKGVLIGREIAVKGEKVFRIVDYLGEDEALCGVDSALDQWMEEQGYEYVDLYGYGIAHEILAAAGLQKREDTIVIPNYFEPFEQRNIDLNFYTLDKKDIHVFRGMSDQDRPNPVKSGRERLRGVS